MAPEIVRQKNQITPKADIWSVGCLIIEMLTGNPPWKELPPEAVLFKVGGAQKPALPDNISGDLTFILTSCFKG
jgi:mitogen-activated protein kinase kinase kinase